MIAKEVICCLEENGAVKHLILRNRCAWAALRNVAKCRLKQFPRATLLQSRQMRTTSYNVTRKAASKHV